MDLHTLIDKFQANVKILKLLKEKTEHWDVLLIHLLSTRLDAVSRRDWEEYAETNDTTKFQQMIEFLQRRVNVLETVGGKSAEMLAPAKKPNPPRSANHGASQQGSRQCPACSSQHSLYQCEEFSKMTVDEKERVVRRNQLCRNCLRRGHIAKECASESSCRKCRGRHHTQLCYASRSEGSSQQHSLVQSTQQSNNNNEQLSSTPVVTGITSCTSLDKSRTKVLLATAIIIMVDDDGIQHPVRALLDSGSECCFATERLVQRMNVRRCNVNLPIAGIGEAATEAHYKIQSTIMSRISNYVSTIEAFVLPKVTVDLPSISVDASSWSIPTGIKLADPSFYQTGAIDVVLGAEVFFDLFSVAGRIPLGESLPCLVNSVFGWVVSGKTSQNHSKSHIVCNVATAAEKQRNMEKFSAKKAQNTSNGPISPSINFVISQLSNYKHLLLTTAYWKWYFGNLRLAINEPLSASEIRSAELAIVRLLQKDAFPAELEAVKANQTVSTRSRLRWFHPMIDSGGQIGHSSQHFDTHHQILLPGSHSLTMLLDRCKYERRAHTAVQLITNTTRLQFWTLGGKITTQRIVHNCVMCLRVKPKAVEQFMVVFPSQRVITSRPFSVVSIDSWRPIYLKPRHRKDTPPKAYDLSTANILQGFRCFMSRGGIHWRCNPPRGSHVGGLWEAAIKPPTGRCQREQESAVNVAYLFNQRGPSRTRQRYPCRHAAD